MKSAGSSAATALSKVMTMAPSSGVAANRRSFAVLSVRRNNGSSGLKSARGCGSNVNAAAGCPRPRARSIAAPITARWPRCNAPKIAHGHHRAPQRAGMGGASMRSFTTMNGCVGACSGVTGNHDRWDMRRDRAGAGRWKLSPASDGAPDRLAAEHRACIGIHHASRGITACGAMPAAAKIPPRASGTCSRDPSSTA